MSDEKYDLVISGIDYNKELDLLSIYIKYLINFPRYSCISFRNEEMAFYERPMYQSPFIAYSFEEWKKVKYHYIENIMKDYKNDNNLHI